MRGLRGVDRAKHQLPPHGAYAQQGANRIGPLVDTGHGGIKDVRDVLITLRDTEHEQPT